MDDDNYAVVIIDDSMVTSAYACMHAISLAITFASTDVLLYCITVARVVANLAS